MSASGEVKICPFCKEEIPTEKTKCPFCAEMLPESAKVGPIKEELPEPNTTQKQHEAVHPTTPPKPSRIKMTVAVVSGLFALTALGAFYIWSSHNRFYIISGSQGFR